MNYTGVNGRPAAPHSDHKGLLVCRDGISRSCLQEDEESNSKVIITWFQTNQLGGRMLAIWSWMQSLFTRQSFPTLDIDGWMKRRAVSEIWQRDSNWLQHKRKMVSLWMSQCQLDTSSSLISPCWVTWSWENDVERPDAPLQDHGNITEDVSSCIIGRDVHTDWSIIGCQVCKRCSYFAWNVKCDVVQEEADLSLDVCPIIINNYQAAWPVLCLSIVIAINAAPKLHLSGTSVKAPSAPPWGLSDWLLFKGFYPFTSISSEGSEPVSMKCIRDNLNLLDLDWTVYNRLLSRTSDSSHHHQRNLNYRLDMHLQSNRTPLWNKRKQRANTLVKSVEKGLRCTICGGTPSATVSVLHLHDLRCVCVRVCVLPS